MRKSVTGQATGRAGAYGDGCTKTKSTKTAKRRLDDAAAGRVRMAFGERRHSLRRNARWALLRLYAASALS